MKHRFLPGDLFIYNPYYSAKRGKPKTIGVIIGDCQKGKDVYHVYHVESDFNVNNKCPTCGCLAYSWLGEYYMTPLTLE